MKRVSVETGGYGRGSVFSINENENEYEDKTITKPKR